jgi:hypothetical protein
LADLKLEIQELARISSLLENGETSRWFRKALKGGSEQLLEIVYDSSRDGLGQLLKMVLMGSPCRLLRQTPRDGLEQFLQMV